jgi:hypothetical protein
MLVPSKSKGVARVSDVVWTNVLDGLPPDGRSVDQFAVDLIDEGKMLKLESTKVNAIAVTGAPRSFPTRVVLPSS